jgi:hypothetical protein
MKKSKYLGMVNGEWECTHVGVAEVQPAFRKTKVNGKRVRTKSHGHQNYYYIFERLTSDEKAMKMIRLGFWQAKQVLRGERSVEYFAEKKARKRSQEFKNKISYSFCD